jgi:hypothetical protein
VSAVDAAWVDARASPALRTAAMGTSPSLDAAPVGARASRLQQPTACRWYACASAAYVRAGVRLSVRGVWCGASRRCKADVDVDIGCKADVDVDIGCRAEVDVDIRCKAEVNVDIGCKAGVWTVTRSVSHGGRASRR